MYIHSKPILLASVTLPVQRPSSVTSNKGIELVGETDDERVGDLDIDSVCKAELANLSATPMARPTKVLTRPLC